MRDPGKVVLAFFASVVGTAFFLLAVARGPGEATSPGQVAGDAARLAELVRGTRLAAPGGSDPTQVTYTFGEGCGSYVGLALIAPRIRRSEDAGEETHLWFRAVPTAAQLLRNPDRPPLPAIALVRSDPASDLVPPGHPRRLFVSFSDGRTSARLGNLSGRADLAAGSVLGRGLAALTSLGPCGSSPDDVLTFAVLARLIRARLCGADGEESPCPPSGVTIYRDSRPFHYRIDVRPLGDEPGLAAFALELRRGPAGEMVDGTIRHLPRRSRLAQPVALALLPPRPSGGPGSPGGPAAPELVIDPLAGGPSAAALSVDFRQLLAGSAWSLGRKLPSGPDRPLPRQEATIPQP
jgi:hypothetical protein